MRSPNTLRALLVCGPLACAFAWPALAGEGCDSPYIEDVSQGEDAGKSAATAPPSAGRATPDTAPDTARASGDADENLWDREALTGTWFGMRTTLEQRWGVKFGLQEQSEVWADLIGGQRRGAVYDGLTTACLALDLGRLMNWPGATIYVKGYQIHGRGPSANLVGNLQLVSSLEASRDTRLYQFWFEQKLFGDRLSIRFGQGGINDELMQSDYAGLYLNASFGLSGLTAADLPSGGPTYPLGTPFVRVALQPISNLTVSAALFNGDPAPAGSGDPQLRDRGGVAFRTDAHALVVGEVAYAVNKEDGATGPAGSYKLGFWYHSGHFADQRFDTDGVPLASPSSNGLPRDHSPDYAVYAIVDQMIWPMPTETDKKKGIGAFFQITAAPAGFNLSHLFIAAGINWIGPFNRPDKETAGIAVAYLGISPDRQRFGDDLVAFTGTGSPYRSNETVIELTYLFQPAGWLQIQPDLQIILNPGGGIPAVPGGKPLDNAVIAGVRATITF